jgi:hypothetical protein
VEGAGAGGYDASEARREREFETSRALERAPTGDDPTGIHLERSNEMIGTRILRGAAAMAIGICAAAPLAAQTDVSEPADQRFGRVRTATAQVRNLPDDKGLALATPAPGTLVRIGRERAGWLEVEVPGGYPVWVHGGFLRATSEADVFEVTRNSVNVRPNPVADVLNYPLPQRLHAGDRLRVIERNDAALPLAEDWVRVWSPPGVSAWLRASDVEPLAPGTDGLALWTAAEKSPPSAPPRPAPRQRVEPKPAPTAADGAEAQAASKALDAAWDLLRAESKKDTPDFDAVRASFETLLAGNPGGELAARARQGIERADALREVHELRLALDREREEREAAVAAAREAVFERSLAKDPLLGVFAARGVVERTVGTDGTPRFLLRRGDRVQGELFCASGRYDLSLFAGLEVGVQGRPLASADAAAPLRLELSRVEVISLRKP